jgi:hypothetical protein
MIGYYYRHKVSGELYEFVGFRYHEEYLCQLRPITGWMYYEFYPTEFTNSFHIYNP